MTSWDSTDSRRLAKVDTTSDNICVFPNHHLPGHNDKMHPSLHLSNLSRLPIAARKIATAACAPHPPPADIERLKRIAKNSPSQAELLLPVYYSILDPQRIPAAEQLESLYNFRSSTGR
ncbi:hypothetical protein C8R47DRAFT_1220959 [Mycena vitilis]|nr:hypothetical protein C8R47DRAFT_1220959 [Mycena vitilis]